ncbi:MAG: hypothetical protein HYZ16_01725 [Bacteroidetes bacterium]|nr:hypothetical protein [Bacteroidota bacterium]
MNYVTPCLLVLLAFTFNRLGAQCAESSSVYAFAFNGNDYEVVKALKNWADAAACAVERGGYLAEINTLEEQDAIWDTLIQGAKIPVDYTVVMTGGGIAYVWIGASDITEEGNWLWDGNGDGAGDLFWTGQGAAGNNDGEAKDDAFFHWGGSTAGQAKEPDDFAMSQDCAGMGLVGWPKGSTLYGVAGEWNDLGCGTELYFVVEKTSTHIAPPQGTGMGQPYPNPSMGMFHLAEKASNIAVYDLLGKVLLTDRNTNQIDLTAYVGSMFIVVYEIGGTAHRARLVKG